MSLFDAGLDELSKQYIGGSRLRALNRAWSGSGLKSGSGLRSESGLGSGSGLRKRAPNSQFSITNRRHCSRAKQKARSDFSILLNRLAELLDYSF